MRVEVVDCRKEDCVQVNNVPICSFCYLSLVMESKMISQYSFGSFFASSSRNKIFDYPRLSFNFLKKRDFMKVQNIRTREDDKIFLEIKLCLFFSTSFGKINSNQQSIENRLRDALEEKSSAVRRLRIN
jgi:hypothetical protein